MELPDRRPHARCSRWHGPEDADQGQLASSRSKRESLTQTLSFFRLGKDLVLEWIDIAVTILNAIIYAIGWLVILLVGVWRKDIVALWREEIRKDKFNNPR